MDARKDGGSPGIGEGSLAMRGPPASLALRGSVADYGIAQGGSTVVRALLTEQVPAHNDNIMFISQPGDPTLGRSALMNIVDSHRRPAEGATRPREPAQATHPAAVGAEEEDPNSEDAQA